MENERQDCWCCGPITGNKKDYTYAKQNKYKERVLICGDCFTQISYLNVKNNKDNNHDIVKYYVSKGERDW